MNQSDKTQPDEVGDKKDTGEATGQRRLKIELGVVILGISCLGLWFVGPFQFTYPTIILYLLVSMSVSLIASAWDHTRIGNALMILFGLPVALFQITAPYILGILGAIITTAFIAAILWIILDKGSGWMFGLVLPVAARTFATLTLTSITMTLFGNKLMSLFEGYMNNASRHRAEYAVDYVGQERIRVALFVLLFGLLVVFTFTAYANYHLTDTPEVEDAILKALVAYVAFDRAYSSVKGLVQKRTV